MKKIIARLIAKQIRYVGKVKIKKKTACTMKKIIAKQIRYVILNLIVRLC